MTDGEDEDERERDGAEVVLLERNRLQLGEQREREEEEDGERPPRRPGGSRAMLTTAPTTTGIASARALAIRSAKPGRIAGAEVVVRHAVSGLGRGRDAD